MADKSISELVAASNIQANDLFVAEQNGTAKKVSGQVFENWLVSFADGHGGIQSIEQTGTSGLTKSYTITMADETTFTFNVNDGNGISGITWTTSGTSGNGQLHTGTITYTDGTTSTVTIKDGLKGNTGAAWYVWIKYAPKNPTASSQMSDTPDAWIGIYSGTSATKPTTYTSYTWYQIKGATGEPGTAASITSATVEYAVHSSGTTAPTTGWSTVIPTVGSGMFLWTRTTTTWNTGSPVVSYSVSKNGVDGNGAVSKVLDLGPDDSGNVVFTAENVPYGGTNIKAQLDSILSSISSMQSEITNNKPKHFSITLSSLPRTVNDANITADMRVIESTLADPSVITSDNLSYTTAAESITFTGTINGSTTFDFDLMKVRS